MVAPTVPAADSPPFNRRPDRDWGGTAASLTTNGSIQVVSASAVAAGFTAGPTTGAAPLAVTFTNNSSGATYGCGILATAAR